MVHRLTESGHVLYYSFAAFVLPMQHSQESSPAALSGAGTYASVFLAVAVCSLFAALLLLAADRAHRRAVGA